MFDNIAFTLSAAVAASGTFTTAYPTGRSAGSYTGSYAHKLVALQSTYVAPTDFTLTFGASTITVNWAASHTTLPVGTVGTLQVDRVGDDNGVPESAIVLKSVVRAPIYRIDLGAPILGTSTAISASQSVSAGANFLLNGATAGVLDVPRNVIAAWTTASVLTITGKDAAGNTVVEKSASGTSHTGKKAFKSITSISSSIAITSATVGTGNVLGLPVFAAAAENILAEYVDGVEMGRVGAKIVLPFEIEATELSAGTAENLVSPVAGWIAKVRGIVQEAIVTGGAITAEINTVAVVGLSITAANSDAVGVRYSGTPTARHSATSVLAAGDRITLTPAAAFNGGGAISGVVEIDASAAGRIDGTFVAGVTTVASATTGDTRGTYAPSTTLDGATAFSLLMNLPDPSAAGVAQYTG